MKFSLFFLEHLQDIMKSKLTDSELCNKMVGARRLARALDLDDYDFNSTEQPTDAAGIRVRRIAETCANQNVAADTQKNLAADTQKNVAANTRNYN